MPAAWEIIPSRTAFATLILENKQPMRSPWCFRRLETEYTLAYMRGIQIHLQAFFSLDQESKGKETSVAEKLAVSRWIDVVKV